MTIDLSQKFAEQPDLGLHGGASTRAGLLRGREEGDLGGERVGEGAIFGLSRFMFPPLESPLGRLELLEGRLRSLLHPHAGVEDPQRGLLESR